MKKLLFFAATLFCFFAASAQIENPVTWSYGAQKIKPGVYEIHLTATMEGKWHIYSQDAGAGPQPTTFSFDKNPLIKADGNVKENGTLVKEYDENFRSTLKFYNGKVDFVQTVKVKAPVATLAKGKITYMVCNDKKCLPPRDVAFSVKINPKS